MRFWLNIAFVILAAIAIASGQSLSEDIAKAKSIKLLDATQTEVAKLLGNTSPFMYDAETFSLESSRIQVSYSSGKCTDSDSYGVSSDDWAIGAGKVVMIEILPRGDRKVSEIDVGKVQLRKDRLYRGRGDYHIYYNKREGIAITTHGDQDYVEAVILFPSKASNSLLCRDKKIQAYYAKTAWKRDWQPVYACILRNQYADVVDVEVALNGNRTFEVRTKATDPENDVLSYVYKVTAGKVIGGGAMVVWDLSDAPIGEHSISVGVDDGAGIVGRTVTKTVIVK